MKLIIVRHGPAGTPLPDAAADDARTLTKKGRKETRAAMKGLVAQEPRLSRVITSPLPRAAETADLLVTAAKTRNPRRDERLGKNGDALALVEELKGTEEVVALVGHDPQLSLLVEQLATGYKRPRAHFVALTKGGAAALAWRDDAWTLDWLATRRQLAGDA